MDDRRLLQEYVEHGSESAFRTLVERHLNMVRSTALRQVNDPGVADEVCQAVFILLARKASSFPRGAVLAGWLFRTTRFVGARALRGEQRRRRREQEAFEMHTLSADDEIWKRIAPRLDEALEQLPDSDRNAVLLRFCEGRQHHEVGAALGLSEEAARKRVNRALDKLRDFFAKRGCAVTTAGLASLLTANASQAVPTSMVSIVTGAALASGSAAANALPLVVKETLAAWRLAKLKLAGLFGGTAAVLIGVGIAVTPAKPTALSTETNSAGSPIPRIAASAPDANSASPSARSSIEQVPWGERTLRLRVIAKDNGDAVKNAPLVVNTVTREKWESRFDLASDEDGLASVPYPADTMRLDVGVLAWGWAARFATWVPGREDPIPVDYTLQLDRVTNTMGGWLRDANDQPVAHAEILVSFQSTGDSAERETPRERPGVMGEAVIARSDVRGWWTSASIPPTKNGGFQLKARHPQFRTTSIAAGSDRSEPTGVEAETLRQLWAGTLVTRMSVGPTLSGRVLDDAGRPVSGANIVHSPQSDEALSVTTDADGLFSFPNLADLKFDFTVIATGFAPEYREIDLSDGSKTVEVRLKPGAMLRLRLVDEQGMPVPDATVVLEQWGELRHKIDWRPQSDADGRIEWNSAPPDEKLELCATKSGWCYTRGIWVQADGQEHVIKMYRALDLMGNVTDADTGQPIAEVKAFPGYGTGEHSWERLDTRRGANGRFSMRFEESRRPWRVRVEAEGYHPFVSEPISPETGGWLDVVLHRQDPSKAIRGVVFRPDGQPAAGAQVALLTLEHNVRLTAFVLRSDSAVSLIKEADASGAFSFNPDPQAHTLVAASPEGFAKVRVRDSGEPVNLTMQPWGRIEGVVLEKARTRPVESVVLDDPSAQNYQGRMSLGFRWAEPDAEGRFSFDFVPPQTLVLWLNSGVGIPFHHKTIMTVAPGDITRVVIGETGWKVKGQLATPEGVNLDWKKQLTSAHIGREIPESRPPAGLDARARAFWAVDFWDSESGRKLAATQRGVELKVLADGSFVSDDVIPEGDYLIRAFTSSGLFECDVTIPPADTRDGVCDLGRVVLARPRSASR